MDAEFKFSEGFSITDEVKEKFDENGFVVIRGILDKEEVLKLKTALEDDKGVMTKAYKVSDGVKSNTKMCLWNHPGNDITGMMARCHKIATTMEELLGGEVYHYHTKLMMKEASGGGKFLWHQDYGYWYHNGCLFPDMGTVFVAVDECTESNGCLHVLPASHKLGRVDHQKIGGQMSVEAERLKHLLDHFNTLPVQLNPGDALFFHCNLLHTSSDNTSPHRRWAFLIAYNRASNNPVKQHHHPRYVKLVKVPDSAIKDCATATDLSNKGYIRQTGEIGSFTVEDRHLN